MGQPGEVPGGAPLSWSPVTTPLLYKQPMGSHGIPKGFCLDTAFPQFSCTECECVKERASGLRAGASHFCLQRSVKMLLP